MRSVIGERDVHRSAGAVRLKLARASVAGGTEGFVAVAGFVGISWAARVGAAAWSGKFVSGPARIGGAARPGKFVSGAAAGLEVAAWSCEFAS